MATPRRKLAIYRNMGELAYFEYWYSGELKNKNQVDAFLEKNPDYQCGSVQIIKTGYKSRLREYGENIRSTPRTAGEILAYCEGKKQSDKSDKPVVLKEEKDYIYNKESAEEWVALAKENNWDLTESIKALCDHLNLAPVVVAPVLQRYGFIEKRKPVEKVYKYSKEQVEVWWNDKFREGLTTVQQAERIGIHFLQLGRLFTQYGFQPKKEKKEKKERKRRGK